MLLLHFKHQLHYVVPAFHAVTGCDTVRQFAGHGKVIAWKKAFKQNSQLLTSLGFGELQKKRSAALRSLSAKYEPQNDKANKMTCASSEDSDQPGYLPSLIRVFAVRSFGR